MKFSSEPPTAALFFVGEIETSRSKFSSEIKNFDRDQKFRSGSNFFDRWALWDGPNDHFGQNGLIPNRILAFARPKWTKMAHFGPFWPKEAHFGPFRSANRTLAIHDLKPVTFRAHFLFFLVSCPQIPHFFRMIFWSVESPQTLVWETDFYTPQVQGGDALLTIQRQRCIKFRALRGGNFYTPLPLN